MTKIARVYGGSLYDLAAEEKLDGQIMEQMIAVRQIFRENPGYLKLLGEPAIPEDERLKMIEEAFGGQAERYLVNFLKLLCERKILREFAGCCEEFIRRYNSAHGIAEAVVTSAVKLSDTQMEALKAKLEKLSGKKVYLVQKTDASVLGGLRVELEGVQDIQVYYGMIQALKGVSFSVNEGEVIALIGANGAGKTTTLHTVTGLLRAKSGHIIYDGQDITKVPPHKIVTMGMAHVPEGRRVFANMTVLQNLKMGAFTRSDKNEIDATIEKVYKRFPRLKERQNQTAGTLSGGEQQMLAMGRALMSQPKIILMDEPSMGLSPIFVNEIFDIIKEVSESGTTVLLVEQNAKKALSIADRAYVLETGRITLEGKASDLLHDESVQKAYLGE